ncbi:hypothetical protein X975_02167, partial [Stegodyphus mimosarum]
MHEVCVDSLLKCHQQKTGGPDMIVEVDESMFTKHKNNVGWILPHWIFGGVWHETNKSFLVKVPNQSMSIILEAIKVNI